MAMMKITRTDIINAYHATNGGGIGAGNCD